MCKWRYNKCPDFYLYLYHATVDLAFITDDDAKMLKNATYFA